ncbi:MAG TPA: hypothetical protein VF192_07140 [Longimicrobiales bacterium]
MPGFVYLAITARADLRKVAAGECTLEAITRGRCEARSSCEARRLLQPRYPTCYVIWEQYAEEIITDYRENLSNA